MLDLSRRRALAVLAPLLILTACSSQSAIGGPVDAAPPDANAAIDGGASGRDAAGGSDAASSGDAATCEVGAPPANLPALVGKVVVAGVGDAGAPPAMTGGDETGLWVYSAITLYLEAGSPVDPAASKVEGTGWLDLTGTTFRQGVNTVTTLSTSVAGVVLRGNDTRARGTYTKAASALTFTAVCRDTLSTDTSITGAYAFSRVDATHARILVTGSTALGPIILLTDLEKAK